MGMDHIAEIICVYCGQVMGRKTVNAPDSFDPPESVATHGICGDCFLKLHPQIAGPERETRD